MRGGVFKWAVVAAAIVVSWSSVDVARAEEADPAPEHESTEAAATKHPEEPPPGDAGWRSAQS